MSHLQLSYKHHGYILTITKHMEYNIIYSNNAPTDTQYIHTLIHNSYTCSEHGWGHSFTEYLASSQEVVAPLPKGLSWLYNCQMLNDPLLHRRCINVHCSYYVMS